MLPAAHRLRRSVDFERTVRRGTRAGRPTLVVHLLTDSGADSGELPRVGLVVSKAVGNAVRRNKVKRRIRASAAGLVDVMPSGSCVVVRALTPAASASYQDLDEDLVSCLSRAVKKAGRGTRGTRHPLSGVTGGDDPATGRAAAPASRTDGGISG